MKQQSERPSRSAANLALDVGMFAAFLVALAPRFSGIAIHEWLSIAFGAAVVTHLVLHWQWLVEVTRRFFRAVQWSARANYLLNALLFVDVTIVILSGLLISRSALPLLGITLEQGGGVWRQLHSLAADLSLALMGLHVALHWHWIVSSLRRHVVAPLLPRRERRPALAAQRAGKEA